MHNTLRVVIPNLLMFQVLWWSCILNYPFIAVLSLIGLCLHWWVSLTTYSSVALPSEAAVKQMLFVLVLGIAGDAVIAQVGGYDFGDVYRLPILGLPVWLLILWAGFATTLATSMKSLASHKALWLGLFTLFGPLAYVAGEQFERVILAGFSYVLLPLFWFFLGWFALGWFSLRWVSMGRISMDRL